MKNRILKSSLLTGLLLVFSFSTLLQVFSPALGPGTAHAAGEKYAFYYPNDTKTVGSINTNLRDRDPADEADLTTVYAKDGFWSRLNGAKLSEIPFNRAVSNGANDGRGEDRFDVDMKGQDDDQFIFTTDYLCYNNGQTLVADQSKGAEIGRKSSFYYVSVAVVVELGEKFQDKQTYDTSVFPLWVKKYDQFTLKQEEDGGSRQYLQWALGAYVDSAGDVFGQGFDPEEPKNGGNRFGNSVTKLYNDANLTDAVKSMRKDSGLNGGCIPPEATDYQLKTDNYWKNKAKWKEITNKVNSGEVPGSGGTASGADEPTLECDTKFLNPLSWVSCPIIDGLSTLVSELDSLITSQLSVGSPGNSEEPNQIFCSRDTPGDDRTECAAYHKAWSVFRNLALGILVIVGLLMILSEIAGMEIFDAYTIRKTLPRLVVGAIGITLSWQLMQFLVEFTNALGYGIRYLIYQPFLDAGIDTAVLQGGGKAAVGLLGLSGFFLLGVMGMLSFVATAAIGVIVAFLTLVVREIIIIAAVIISPIAIALYILPNTERFYKMWWDTFFKALMMFPIIAAMIASGRVFAALASNGGTVSQILGFAAYFAPYFLMPMTFKYAGAAIAGIGGALNNNEVTNTARKGLGQYRGRKRQENWQNAKNFQRFSDRNMFTRGLNRASGVMTSPKVLKGGWKGAEDARLTGMLAHGAETLKNDRIHQQHQNDDNYLLALGNRELAQKKLQTSKDDLLAARQEAAAEEAAASKEGRAVDTSKMDTVNSLQADVDAREHGLRVANQVASRNDGGAQLAAINQLVGTGYQFAPGEEGYQEVRGSVEKIVGTHNPGAVGDVMNNMQYAFKAGGRGDLAGINHGADHNIKSGWKKIPSTQRGQGKPTGYQGASDAWLGKGNRGKDGKTLGAVDLGRSIAASVKNGETKYADLLEYKQMLEGDKQWATDANKEEIDKQLAGIHAFAQGSGEHLSRESTPDELHAFEEFSRAATAPPQTVAGAGDPEIEKLINPPPPESH